MQVCYHCKREAGSRPVRYHDLESNITYTYHQDCFFGAVRESVVTEYVNLIMKVANQRRGKWNALS